MKTKILVSAILGCSLLAASPMASARPDSGSKTNVQRYSARFTLMSEAGAPAGAKGKARIDSRNVDGTSTAGLSLQTFGLETGTYNVSAIIPDGPVALGQITLAPGRGRGRIKSNSKMDLPVELDARSVTGLVVSDTSDNRLFSGDLTSDTGKSQSVVNETVPVIADDAEPDATGTARLRSTTKNGKTRINFQMIVRSLPPNTAYTVEMDGTAGGTATSNKKGQLIVKKLPADVTSIQTIRLLDETGGEAARAEL